MPGSAAAGQVEYRLLTPRAPGGIAVVAVTGAERVPAVRALLSGGAVPAAGAPPRTAELVIDGEVIDQVVVVARAGAIELQLHGSEAVLRALESAVGLLRPPDDADPAARLLREARSEAQLALALEQLAMPWSELVAGLRASPPPERGPRVVAALARSRVARALAEPLRLVICGEQNAGKSTLMNRLLLADRVLTGATPGVTRDPVRELVDLDGYPVLLVDTAGEGEASGELDRLALARARAERAGAWRLVVADGSRPFSAACRALLDATTLLVRSKADLPPAAWPADVPPPHASVSCLDPAAAPRVRREIGRALAAQLAELEQLAATGG